VTSDFLRARQTAADMGARMHLTPQVDTLIHECTPTPEHPEYATYHSPEDVAHCAATLETVRARYLVPTPAADTWDVLVCHGNVIRWLTLKALGADVRNWYGPDIANASLTVIAVRPDGTCRLVTFSDTGHIPAEKQTWAGRGLGAKKPVH
jgi:serine/threonine-protein phosphatase PGAM5